MTPAEWAALLASLGAGAVILKLVEAAFKWIGGKAGRERDIVAFERSRASDEQARGDALDRKLDTETRKRRKATEYAAVLRRVAIEHGVLASELPPWPSEMLD